MERLALDQVFPLVEKAFQKDNAKKSESLKRPRLDAPLHLDEAQAGSEGCDC